MQSGEPVISVTFTVVSHTHLFPAFAFLESEYKDGNGSIKASYRVGSTVLIISLELVVSF